MPRIYLFILISSVVALLLPATWNTYSSVWQNDWRDSSRYDGQVYLLSVDSHVSSTLDSTGVAASIATLLNWSGAEITEAEVATHFEESGSDTSLAGVTTLAADFGLEGQWLQAEAAALSRLKVPFIALMGTAGGRTVIVRDVRGGYLFVTDPSRGNVLYPLESFAETWTGHVFAFPEPPAQPEEWR